MGKPCINVERTEGILGQSRLVSFQGLSLSLGVHGANAELVLVALGQAGHLGLGALRRRHGDPAPGLDVHPLDDVVVDRLPAVVLGLLPRELGALRRDVRHFERALWFRWLAYMKNIRS